MAYAIAAATAPTLAVLGRPVGSEKQAKASRASARARVRCLASRGRLARPRARIPSISADAGDRSGRLTDTVPPSQPLRLGPRGAPRGATPPPIAPSRPRL